MPPIGVAVWARAAGQSPLRFIRSNGFFKDVPIVVSVRIVATLTDKRDMASIR